MEAQERIYPVVSVTPLPVPVPGGGGGGNSSLSRCRGVERLARKVMVEELAAGMVWSQGTVACK